MVIITYEFDKSKLADAWEHISQQWDLFRSARGATRSVQILRKSGDKGYRIRPNLERAKLFPNP